MVSDKSHSAENLEESLTLAKRSVSGKIFLKKSHRKNIGLLRQQKSDIACRAYENLILTRKIFLLKNVTMPETVKGGTL